MSIILSTSDAMVIDHEAWILKIYERYVLDPEEEIDLRNVQQLFDLRTPFMMDGQAEKVSKQMDDTLDPAQPPKKKKKKEVMPTTETCQEMAHVLEVFTALRVMPEFKKHFNFVPSAEDFSNNNKSIKDTRKRFTEVSCTKLPVPSGGSTSSDHQTLVLEGNKYIVPGSVEYICDDVKNILSHTGNEYDLVVMDPPWWNKHVRRRNNAHGSHHGYDMMNVEDIVHIPVGKILGEGALVVIWCTNNDSQMREITEGLHNWGVDLVATWYWLKLTRGGEPITPLSVGGHGKRPYERILLARKPSQDCTFTDIPDGLVLCSIPSGMHSHKPPLAEILKDYVAPESKCLEIFARSLIPGWTSYGLEVLKLQHSFLYEE